MLASNIDSPLFILGTISSMNWLAESPHEVLKMKILLLLDIFPIGNELIS